MDKFLILSYVASQDGNIKGTTVRDNKFIMRGNQTGALIEKLEDGSVNYVEMNLITGIGVTKNYYSDGTLYYFYEQIRGIRNGKYEQYYPNGVLHIQAHFKENKLHGEELRYEEDGILRDRINHVNGLTEGTSFSYTKSGEVENEFFYVKSELRFLRCFDLNPNSEISRVDCCYRDNKKYEGRKEYYKNGICARKCSYVNGKLNGICIRYDMKGRIHTEGEYKDGKKIGEFKYYDTRGKITHIEKFN